MESQADPKAEKLTRREFAGRLGSLGLSPLIASAALKAAQKPQKAIEESKGLLHVDISDYDLAQPVTARCYLTNSAKQNLSPANVIRYERLMEQNFIAPGKFEIALPADTYTLTIERGPEYYPETRRIGIQKGVQHSERIELRRWINMNALGWYSGDLHNHRRWEDMPELLLANDLNLAPTLTQWFSTNYFRTGQPDSSAPPVVPTVGAVRVVDATHAYSIADTEVERMYEGPGAICMLALRFPLAFRGDLVSPPNTVFTELAHRQCGYVDAEKIIWRDTVALVALGQVDFAGLVCNHFNRHGVIVKIDDIDGPIAMEKPEYLTPEGIPLWFMEIYYKFLNCGFRLPVSAGSATGVMPSPLGFNRVYVYLPGGFEYHDWFRGLKAGRSFGTNGPMLFLTVNDDKPGARLYLPERGGDVNRLRLRAEARSARELDRLEIIWSGQVVKTIRASGGSRELHVEYEFDAQRSGWFAARVFEKPAPAIEMDVQKTGWLSLRVSEKPAQASRFAHTSPIYVRVGNDPGLVPEDAKFFLDWIDREIEFYKNLKIFRSEAERVAMLSLFRLARPVYERVAIL
jgi:hypothetical protein